MWLYESTDNFQVVISYGGEGSLTTGSLTLIETNQLWTMLLVIVLSAGGIVYVWMFFRYYDQVYSVSREKKHVFLCVMAIGLIASIPFLCGYNIVGADTTYHLQRIEGVKDGLLGGQFPVRLEPRWVYDHGYANAVFYCNAFLYFPAILRLLGFTVTAAYNAYSIALTIATAWISYYCFSRMFGKYNIGILCSALYTLSVARIYKLVITSTTGEGNAMAFLPLIIYGLYRIFTEDFEDRKYKTAWIPLMFGLAGVIQSHVLTCEVTALVILIFCLLQIRKVVRLKVFVELVKGAVSSALISLWFLVPFADYYITQDVHVKHVSARTIQERGLKLTQLAFHFWFNGPAGQEDFDTEGIGLVLVFALGVFLILRFSGVFRKNTRDDISFFKVTALVGMLLLFMSTDLFPWDRIQSINSVTATLVSSLQFPDRFLGWGTVCLVAVFGCCLQYFADRAIGCYRTMAAVAIFGVTTSGLWLLDLVNSNQGYFELYDEAGMGFGHIAGAEYLIQGTDYDRLTFENIKPGDEVEIQDYEKFYLNTKFHVVNHAAEAGYVDLPFLLYKGYRAVDADTGDRMPVCAGENMAVRVVIPGNFEGNLKVSFVSPQYWRISEWISVSTMAVPVIRWRRYRRGQC